jgi:hypothetical protein
MNERATGRPDEVPSAGALHPQPALESRPSLWRNRWVQIGAGLALLAAIAIAYWAL